MCSRQGQRPGPRPTAHIEKDSKLTQKIRKNHESRHDLPHLDVRDSEIQNPSPTTCPQAANLRFGFGL